jgi:hypothetical protein
MTTDTNHTNEEPEILVFSKISINRAPRGHPGAESPAEAAHATVTCDNCGIDGYVHFNAFEFGPAYDGKLCAWCNADTKIVFTETERPDTKPYQFTSCSQCSRDGYILGDPETNIHSDSVTVMCESCDADDERDYKEKELHRGL